MNNTTTTPEKKKYQTKSLKEQIELPKGWTLEVKCYGTKGYWVVGNGKKFVTIDPKTRKYWPGNGWGCVYFSHPCRTFARGRGWKAKLINAAIDALNKDVLMPRNHMKRSVSKGKK